MFVRLAIESDVEEIVAMARANVEETLTGEPFSPDRARQVLANYFERANPTFFVVDQRREILGFLLAHIREFEYRDGFYTTQGVLYVKPVNRGSRAAPLLMRHLVDWSRKIGAVAILGGNNNSFQSDRTARFLEHYGFRCVGYEMRLDL